MTTAQSTLTPAALHALLPGRWVFQRAEGQPQATHGTLTVLPHAQGSLLGQDRAVRAVADASINTFRDYHIALIDDAITVAYIDATATPRPLHEFRFERAHGVLTAQHTHLCAQDHYHARVIVQSADTFEIHCQVRGPRKDYRIDTRYTRVREGTPEAAPACAPAPNFR